MKAEREYKETHSNVLYAKNSYCNIIDNRSSAITQAKLIKSINNHVLQRGATIDLKKDNVTYSGESNKDKDTRENMNTHPKIAKYFASKVLHKEIKLYSEPNDGDKWNHKKEGDKDIWVQDREWSHCAEPNAFSKLVKDNSVFNKSILDSWSFPQQALYFGKRKKPCEVCKQWVENEQEGLKILDSFKEGFPDQSFREASKSLASSIPPEKLDRGRGRGRGRRRR